MAQTTVCHWRKPWLLWFAALVAVSTEIPEGRAASQPRSSERNLLKLVTEVGHRLGWRTAGQGDGVFVFPVGEMVHEVTGSGTFTVSLSPNGTQLVFFQSRPVRSRDSLAPMDLTMEDVETGSRSTLGLVVRDPSLLAWSPDGEKLAVIATLASTDPNVDWPEESLFDRLAKKVPERTSRLFAFSVADKSLEEFKLGAEPLNWIRSDQIWSPDGTKLLYVISRDLDLKKFRGEIRVLTLARKEMRLLAYGDLPTWSPVDDRIVFRGEDKNFYMIRSDGSGQELLLKPKPKSVHPYDLLSPFLWSPDGRWLLVPRGSAPGMVDLFVMDPETKEMVRIQSRTQPSSSWKGRRS